ncbi:MAG: site-specific DNA-methyltransferase [Ruminococcaceae bacterium]|nr:site-specific DNA-methyltransferase [Oscillospiraceae bacterium]
MEKYPHISEGILGEETVAKTNTKLFLDLVEQYFPEAIKDGEVDFTALKEEMGEFPEVGAEHYDFTWAGKQAAKKEAQDDAFGRTLRFYPDESVNPDSTENLYIEGDNLEVLKLLRRNYRGQIKMIYIDPPYNTEKDRIYRDNFTMTEEELAKLSGDIVDNVRFQKAKKDGAKYHTNWLNMMYPRLKLARELLAEDGVILINMDEHEITNLHILMRSIFNDRNDLGAIVWDKRNPKGDANGIAYQHENILVYSKNKIEFFSKHDVQRAKKNAKRMIAKANQLFMKKSDDYTLEDINKDFSEWIRKQDNLSGGERGYCKIDENGKIYQSVSMAWPNKKKAPDDYFIPLVHPTTGKPCPVPNKGWRNPSATMKELLENDLIIFGDDETTQPRRKYFLEENMSENIPSILYYGGSDTDILADMDIPFDNPKVVDVVKDHISAFAHDSDIVLDFFSGSATTAHAVMQLNAEDGQSRRFILVQFPELCEEDTETYKAGFQNICEIGKERIRRSAKKIAEENPDAKFDGGFKVFKTADTTIRWNKLNDTDLLELEKSQKTSNDKIDFTDGYNDIDVVYEIMLRHHNIPLSTPIEKLDEVGERTFIFADSVVVCLEPQITDELIEKLAALEPTPAKFILRDSAFGDDIEFKDVSFRRLSALIQNHQSEEEKKSKYNSYTVEFI